MFTYCRPRSHPSYSQTPARLLPNNSNRNHRTGSAPTIIGDHIAVKTAIVIIAIKSAKSGTGAPVADEVSDGLLWAAATNVFSALLKA